MKTTTISVNVYEIGDVIEMEQKNLRLEAKRRTYAESKRAVVIDVAQRIDKLFSYKMIASNGKSFTLTPEEQGNERYVGHIDLGLLFEGGGANG